MKKIQSKIKGLECTYIIHQFVRCSMGANSIKGDVILTKFKLFYSCPSYMQEWTRSIQKRDAQVQLTVVGG